jgi:hypothetical protein
MRAHEFPEVENEESVNLWEVKIRTKAYDSFWMNGSELRALQNRQLCGLNPSACSVSTNACFIFWQAWRFESFYLLQENPGPRDLRRTTTLVWLK